VVSRDLAAPAAPFAGSIAGRLARHGLQARSAALRRLLMGQVAVIVSGIWSASVLALRAHVCWGGLVDAADLARRFALGRAARLSDGPVARGKQGLVWRLDSAEGSWAVKMPFDRSSEDEVRVATAFQEAACAAGVPAPRVRRTTQGCVFAAMEGRQVRVYEWVDLQAPDPRLDPERVGAVVAAIHRVPAPGPGPLDPWYHEPVGAEGWDHLIGQLVQAGAPFAGRLAALRDELVALESWIEPPQTLQTCHRDLWADNLLPTPGGGVCVIDWENSGPADPSQEFGCVLFEFARADPGRARALTSAYRKAGGPAAVNRRGHFSMLIAQLGHITEIAATDWLQPNPRSPQRADSAAWISEVLDEPHTRERLETILAAV
jgi:aminoglycoside phosphotransferase (APT) family kinase protein